MMAGITNALDTQLNAHQYAPTMTLTHLNICIDADIGEALGPYRMGDDEALMPLVTSANIACGFHAGDPVVMTRSIELALKHDVCIGAHPGFNDIRGFGRRRMAMPAKEIEYMVTYQIGALMALAEGQGARVDYVKPHGALNNMAHEDRDMADAIARGIRSAGRDLVFVANCLSEMVAAGERAGVRVLHEAYADRHYLPNGRLMPRDHPESVIRDADQAAERTLEMLETQTLIALDGTRMASRIDTFCIHGDEPTAVPIASAIRARCAASGVTQVKVSQLAA